MPWLISQFRASSATQDPDFLGCEGHSFPFAMTLISFVMAAGAISTVLMLAAQA